MISVRATAVVVGIFILAAYSILVSLFTDSIPLIILFEVLAGAEVIAISLLMYPLLKPWGDKLTLGYLIGKILEGSTMLIAAFLILSNSEVLLKIRDLIFVYHAYIFIVSGMFFYVLLYKSQLVPRFISLWGIVALVSLLIGNLLELAGNTSPMIAAFYPLIMLNEIFLAFWLIVKGFNVQIIQEV